MPSEAFYRTSAGAEIKATRQIVLYPGTEHFNLDKKTEVMPLASLLAMF